MEIRNLKNITTEELLSVFNRSFSDYVVPFHLSLEQLELKIEAEGIDMELSAGTFESEKLVGFILSAEKEENGKRSIYNAGTGIIPEFRGHGLVRKMYDAMLPVFKERKADILILEVIVGNDPAIRAYENLGFKIMRKLLCFNGIVNVEKQNPEVEIKDMEDFQWDLFQSFWDIEPSWQSSVPVLGKIRKECRILGAYVNGLLVGYVIYNPKARKVYQIAVDKKFRKQGVGAELFRRVGHLFEGQTVSVNNAEDTSEHTAAFLKTAAGLENRVSQFEMEKEI